MHWAIQAYHARRPVGVSGVLYKEGAWTSVWVVSGRQPITIKQDWLQFVIT